MHPNDVGVSAEWQVFCDGAGDSERHITKIAWPQQQKLSVWCDEHGTGFELDLEPVQRAIAQRRSTVELRLDGTCTEPDPPYREHDVLGGATISINYADPAHPT